MRSGHYERAQTDFEQFLVTCPSDSEAEIYRNNAAVLKSILPKGTSFEQLSDDDRQTLIESTVMLSVVVPLQGKEPGIAQEIMRGAVARQNMFNQNVNQQANAQKILLQVVNDDSRSDKKPF